MGATPTTIEKNYFYLFIFVAHSGGIDLYSKARQYSIFDLLYFDFQCRSLPFGCAAETNNNLIWEIDD